MAIRLAHGRDTQERNRLAPGRQNKRSRPQPVSAEQLFAALDGREVTIKEQSWLIEAYGVWDAQGQRWVQLSLKGIRGGANYILTLKLAAGAGEQHAVMAVSSWLANPSEKSDILNVA